MHAMDLDIARQAAKQLSDIGPWAAVAFDSVSPVGPAGLPIVGLALFPKMSEEQIMQEMSEFSSPFPPSALVLVTINGPNVNVVVRNRSGIDIAQLVRSVVLDAASQRAPILGDGTKPIGPMTARGTQAWRPN